MKIIFFSRSNSGRPHPFIQEQADAITREYPVQITQVLIHRGGILGYIQGIRLLHQSVRRNKVDLVHAHYGLSGLAAVVCRILFWHSYKIIITYHGSDLNKPDERRFSVLASHFVSRNILVSANMEQYIRKNHEIIPCGIDILSVVPALTEKKLHRKDSDFIVLFCSSFDRPVKDPEFALNVISNLRKEIKEEVLFIELKGYNRQEVSALMQTADALFMCSKTEGSPQVIKEAIAHGLPIVSNDVGEVKLICQEADHCYITQKTLPAFVNALKEINRLRPRIQRRERVLTEYDNKRIAARIYQIYTSLCPARRPIPSPKSTNQLHASHI